MRHRIGIAEYTGLGGNNSPVLLDNQGKLNKIHKTILKQFFKEYDHTGCDYGISDNEFKFGIEPTYFGDDLIIISINKDIEKSYIQTGHAFGYYGTGIRSKTKYYKDCKYNGKFKRNIDNWHKLLTPSVSNQTIEDNKNK